MTLVALPAEKGPIVLLEGGLTYSKIHSERVVSAEETLYAGTSVDKAGNFYMIDPDIGNDHVGQASTIRKFTESGSGGVFATLNPPAGYSAKFDALTFDRSGNMIVAVLFRRKGPSWRGEVRDYYLIEGMPRSIFPANLTFAANVAVLTLVLIVFFAGFLTLFKSRRVI